jgi:BNR/Asp-box repeat
MLRPALILGLSLGLLACGDDGPGGSDGGGGVGAAGAGGSGGTATGGQGGQGAGATGGSGGMPASSVPLFVAQGHLGRLTISCDGGENWVANQSNDDAAICWEAPTNEPDCDHDTGAGRGVAFGDGVFVATFGWGPAGGLFRSTDGVAWEETLTGTTFAGVAYGNGVFVAGSNSPQRSTDGGQTWEQTGPVGLGANARRFGFVDVMGGRFIIAADGSTLAVSSDDGVTWALPSVPAGCGDSIQTQGGIAAGNGNILVLGGDGNACVSSDGGETWSLSDVGALTSSHLIFNGSEFMVWSQGTRHASSDGITWTATPTSIGNLRLGPTAVDANGRIVGVRGGWQVWYADQAFYFSDDGVDWSELAAGSFVGSHPIRAMAFGEATPSSACPAR